MKSKIKDGKAPNTALVVKARTAKIIQIIMGNTHKFTPNFLTLSSYYSFLSLFFYLVHFFESYSLYVSIVPFLVDKLWYSPSLIFF